MHTGTAQSEDPGGQGGGARDCKGFQPCPVFWRQAPRRAAQRSDIDVVPSPKSPAQHLHGGMGVDRDYHLFRYCLWAKHVEMMLGSSAATLAQLGEELAARYIAEAEA